MDNLNDIKGFRIDEFDNVENKDGKYNFNNLKGEEEDKLIPATVNYEDIKDLGDLDALPVDFCLAISPKGDMVITDSLDFQVYMNDKANVGAEFFLYSNKEFGPIYIKKKEEGFTISTGEISAMNQLSNNHFGPKKSIALEDIITPSNWEMQVEKLKDTKATREKEVNRLQKTTEEYPVKIEQELKNYKDELYTEAYNNALTTTGLTAEDFDKEPEAFNEEAPKLSTGSKVARVFLKIFTLGIGETAKYKEYSNKLKDYKQRKKVNDDAWKVFNDNHNTLRHAYNECDQKVADRRAERNRQNEEMKEELEDKKERLNSLNSKIRSIRNEGDRKDRKCKETLEKYHKHTEVIMEGITDLNRRGEVTKDNIFANNWLLKNTIAGKKMGEVDTDNLAAYVVAKEAEKSIYEEYIASPLFAGKQKNKSILAAINTGGAAEQMKNNPSFLKTVDKYYKEDMVIDPDEFVRWVLADMQTQLQESKDPLNSLKAEREKLVNEFGKKPVTEDIITDVAKYIALDKKIGELQKYKDTRRYFSDAQKKAAEELVSEIHMNPEETYDKVNAEGQKVQVKAKMKSNVRIYMGQEYKDALKEIAETQKNASNALKGLKNQHANLMASSRINGDFKYTLPQIAKMVNEVKDKQKEKNNHQSKKMIVM